MQRTCSCSPVNRYQCFIEIALVFIDIHFPLSVLYWELHSFEYSRDTCYLCAFSITPIIVKTLHTFFSLILLQLSLICKSHLWEPKAPHPGLTCCSLGLIKNVFIINFDHLGSEKINWKSFVIFYQSFGNGKVEYLWNVAIMNCSSYGTTSNWGFQALCSMLVFLDEKLASFHLTIEKDIADWKCNNCAKVFALPDPSDMSIFWQLWTTRKIMLVKKLQNLSGTILRLLSLSFSSSTSKSIFWFALSNATSEQTYCPTD